MTDWLSLEACCHSFLSDLAKLCSQTWSVGVPKGGMVGNAESRSTFERQRWTKLNGSFIVTDSPLPVSACPKESSETSRPGAEGSDPISDEVPHDVSLFVSLSESSHRVTQRCWGRASPTQSSLFPGCCWRRTTATTREASQERWDRALCLR